jgi:dTMP kinase
MESLPWWKNSALAALLGFAIPAATFLQGWLQKGRELELQDKKQKQELRLAYMDVLVEGGLEGMALVAEFAARTEQDPDIKTWAEELNKNALVRAETERQRLGEQETLLIAAEEARRSAEQRAAEAQAHAEQAVARAAADREAKQAAVVALREAEQANKEAARASAEAGLVKERVARSKETLQGRPEFLASEQVQQVSASSKLQRLTEPAILSLPKNR